VSGCRHGRKAARKGLVFASGLETDRIRLGFKLASALLLPLLVTLAQ
jgi:hypothetical protein